MRLYQCKNTFCTICREEGTDELFHQLSCKCAFHFNCIYSMVFHGRHYECPNCRNNFTKSWVEDFAVHIYNEADNRGERNLIENRISFLKDKWERDEAQLAREQATYPNMNTPPPLAPPEPFVEDADGSWVVQLGDDIEINPIDALLGPSRYNGPSLIPNRRAPRRHMQPTRDDRDADDERVSSSQTSSD